MIDEIVKLTMDLFGCYVYFSSEKIYLPYGVMESHEAIQIRIEDHGMLLIFPSEIVCVMFFGDHRSNQKWLQHMEHWSAINSWEDANFSTTHEDRYIQTQKAELQPETKPMPQPEEDSIGVM
jgi:hypothetical protein